MDNATPAALWVNATPRHIQDREAIKMMLSCLSTLDKDEFSSGEDIWQQMNHLFSYKCSDKLIMRAIAESQFWSLLLDSLT